MSSKNSPLTLDEALSTIHRLEPQVAELSSEECLMLIHCYLAVAQNYMKQTVGAEAITDWSQATQKELEERQRFENYLNSSLKILNERTLPDDEMLKADWFFLKTSLYLLKGDPMQAMQACNQCETATNQVSNLVFRTLLQEQVQQAKEQCEYSIKELNTPSLKDPKGFSKHSFLMGLLRKEQEDWLTTPNLFYERLAYAQDFTVIEYAQYQIDPRTRPDYFSLLVRAQYLAESAESERKREAETLAERRKFIQQRNERLEREKKKRPSYEDIDISNLDSAALTAQLQELNARNQQLHDEAQLNQYTTRTNDLKQAMTLGSNLAANSNSSDPQASTFGESSLGYSNALGGFTDSGVASNLYALESLNQESTDRRHGYNNDVTESSGDSYSFNISRDSLTSGESTQKFEEKHYSSVDFAKSRAISVKEASQREKQKKRDTFHNAPLFHVFYKDQIFNVRIFSTEPEQLFYNWRVRYHLNPQDEKEIADLKKGIAVLIEGGNNPYDTFKLQLLMLCTLVPDLILVVDESSEQIFPGEWARFSSKLENDICSPNLYSIQAVSDGRNIWLHTHGLSRFKLGELEILQCPAKQFMYYGDIIHTLAATYLRKPSEMKDNNVQLLAHLSDDSPLITTLIPWPEAVQYYNRQGNDNYLGSARDRTIDHNSLSYAIFCYENIDSYKRREYKPLSSLKAPIDGEAILMLSDEEATQRRKLAVETFYSIRQYAEHYPNLIIGIKVPLTISDAEQTESAEVTEGKPAIELCWFMVTAFYEDDKVQARLDNMPFYVHNINKGDVVDIPFNLIADWQLYNPSTQQSITPSSAFILEQLPR